MCFRDGKSGERRRKKRLSITAISFIHAGSDGLLMMEWE
jgi:hypothetical protein